MAIQIPQILDQFKVIDFKEVVSNYIPNNLTYKTYFPSLYHPSLTFEALQRENNLTVAADVVAFNSRAPRKGRQVPGKISASIPKVEIAKTKEESDINLYRQLVDASRRLTGSQRENVENRIGELIYGDATACLDGVNARLEWIAKRVASTGKCKLTLVNNAGGVVTAVDVDFGIPSGNITNAGTDWDTVATATPIADIKQKVAAARTAGIILNYMFMDQATFDRMVATAEVQKFAASFAQNALNLQQVPNLAAVNTSLRSNSLPQIILWDSYVQLESKAGALTSTSGWEDGAIVFSATPVLGNTVNTTTADGWIDLGNSTKELNDFVLVKTFAEEDPITVVTKGIAYAVPVLGAAKATYILKTQL